MKTILCYGDSNTWGWNPATKNRHLYEKRWTTVLQHELGKEYVVIPEGLNGRTTVLDDPIGLHKNGLKYLPPCLESHKPIDLIVLMLGTNDLKHRYSFSPADIAKGAGILIDIINKSDCGLNGKSPQVLILIPPEIRKLSDFADIFKGSREKSLLFPSVFKAIANEKGVPYLDIGSRVRLSDIDGIHFTADQHEILGKMLASEVLKLT